MTARRLTNDDWGLDSSCFVCEARNDRGLQLELWVDDETGDVWTDLNLGTEFSGAPTLVHGGVTLAILDEVQAWAVIALAHSWAVTVETAATFSKPIRLGTEYRAVGEISGRDGDRVTTRGRIETPQGLVCVTSTAQFQVVGEAEAVRFSGAEVSDRNRPFLAGD
jgi:acyl-coenzyme A thioesterase PaaI-like protein